MSNNIIEIAAQAMHVTIEDAQKHYKIIDGINAFYFGILFVVVWP